jgi:hypothetical protein
MGRENLIKKKSSAKINEERKMIDREMAQSISSGFQKEAEPRQSPKKSRWNVLDPQEKG